MAETEAIARPYAKAIFAIASEQNGLELWSERLTLLAAIAKDERVQHFLDDPRTTWHQHGELFTACIAEDKTKVLHNLILVLAANRRLVQLPLIAKLFTELRSKHENSLAVEITTTIKLDSKLEQQLQKVLTDRFAKQVMVKYKVDDSILGGLVVKAGDLVIDGSVHNQLQRLRRILLD